MDAERELGNGGLAVGVPAPGPTATVATGTGSTMTASTVPGAYPLDLATDAHVHTGFSVGRDAVGVVVTAADRAGLAAVTFADQVGPETTWLPAYADAVRRAQQRTEMRLRVAAEIEVVRLDGWLAWPVDLADLDAVSVALTRLPWGDGPAGPREVRALLAAGALRPADVAEMVVGATVRGMERATRYAPAQLARPLSLLGQAGIDESQVPPELLEQLVSGCRATNTTVEISEAWRSPSVRLARRFVEAGVAVLPASDARYAAQVGRWRYVSEI